MKTGVFGLMNVWCVGLFLFSGSMGFLRLLWRCLCCARWSVTFLPPLQAFFRRHPSPRQSRRHPGRPSPPHRAVQTRKTCRESTRSARWTFRPNARPCHGRPRRPRAMATIIKRPVWTVLRSRPHESRIIRATTPGVGDGIVGRPVGSWSCAVAVIAVIVSQRWCGKRPRASPRCATSVPIGFPVIRMDIWFTMSTMSSSIVMSSRRHWARERLAGMWGLSLGWLIDWLIDELTNLTVWLSTWLSDWIITQFSRSANIFCILILIFGLILLFSQIFFFDISSVSMKNFLLITWLTGWLSWLIDWLIVLGQALSLNRSLFATFSFSFAFPMPVNVFQSHFICYRKWIFSRKIIRLKNLIDVIDPCIAQHFSFLSRD